MGVLLLAEDTSKAKVILEMCMYADKIHVALDDTYI